MGEKESVGSGTCVAALCFGLTRWVAREIQGRERERRAAMNEMSQHLREAGEGGGWSRDE